MYRRRLPLTSGLAGDSPLSELMGAARKNSAAASPFRMKNPFRQILLLALTVASAGSGFGQVRPNIVFIMTDDHASSALGCYGNTLVRTPVLDRLAAEGVRFEYSFVTNSLC